MVKKNEETTSDIEALVFRPSKVSWGIQQAIVKLNPVLERLTLLGVILTVVCGLLWAHYSIKAIVVDTSGELTPVASPIPVMALTQFTVKDIKVKDHQLLKKDDLVALTTRYLEPSQISRLKNHVQEMQSIIGMEKADQCQLTCYEALRRSIDEGMAFINQIQQTSEFHRELTDLNKSAKDYLLQLKNVLSLPETLTSLKNELRITSKRILEIDKRKAQAILGMEYEELQNKKISLETQIREKEISTKTMVESVRNILELSLTRIPQALEQYVDSSELRAPTTGRIRFVSLKGVGQTIGGGETLYMITQSSSDLWLKFQIPETEVSKVKPGQEVRIDVSSFPASEYGIQKGSVVEVLDKLPTDGDQSKGPAFIGFAKLASQKINFRSQSHALRSGMQAKVKIIVKHESMLTIMIKKIFSIKDEYLGSKLDD